MIKATGTPEFGFIMETSEKVNGKAQRLTVPTEADCLRIAYFWNRLYIYDKMTGYLKQRIYALEMAKFSKLHQVAAGLLHKIEPCRLSSFNTLCQIVAENAGDIALIAPGEKSQQYQFYKVIICSIVDFSTEINAGAKLRLFPDAKGEPVL